MRVTIAASIALLGVVAAFSCVLTRGKSQGPASGSAHGRPAGRSAESPPAADSVEERVLRHNHLGVARLEQYDYRRAVEEFQKAADLRPDYLPAVVNLGIALYYDSNYPKAIEQFRAALKIDPLQPHAHFMLGLIHTKESRNQEALEEFERVLATHPEDSAANYNVGLIFMRSRDYEQAIRCFEKVLSLEPRHVSAVYNLGMAFMRAGKREEAQKMMAFLRELKGEDQGGSPMGSMGSQYQDEGTFAIAINPIDYPFEPGAEKPAVRFVDVTSSSGIQFTHGAASETLGAVLSREIKAAGYTRRWAEQNLVPAFGSGAAFLDYNGDGKPDIYLVNCSSDPSRSRNALYRNNGDGTFTDVTQEAGVGDAGYGMGVAVGDYNNDGHPDLYVTNYGRNILYRNDKNGHFTDVTSEAGVGGAEDQWSLSAAFFDYDHDGDLDLYVTNFVDLEKPAGKESFRFPEDFRGQPNLLFRNNGNGTFINVAGEAKVSGGKRSTAVVMTDYNESRDIDFLVLNYDSAGELFSNNRDGTFTDVATKAQLSQVYGCFGFACGDLDKDGYPDFFFPQFDGTGAGQLFRSNLGRSFVETRLAPKGFAAGGKGRTPGWASSLLDYDNDGALDILVLTDRCHLFRNMGKGQFVDVTADAGLADVRLTSPRSVALGDYDGDGDVDVLLTENGGRPLLLRNDGGNRNHYLRLNLTTISDNKSAIGTKLEIRSGSLYQKIEVTGSAGYLSQGSTDIILGIGTRQNVDSLRLLWPTGVLQAEITPLTNSLLKIQQLDRKGTSCPLLYAWNGTSYGFVTDFLGGSAFGSLVAPGRYNSTDTDEYVLVESSQLKARDGLYSIKMNNQLEEVMFIDEVKLLAVDHPADVQIFPNERLMPSPPFPEFKLFVTKNAYPPVGAFDDLGRDVLPAIRRVDRVYPDAFSVLPFKGYAEKHSLILDLGNLMHAKKVLLLLTAWIDYADSTSNLAASQAGERLIPPYLEVVNERGEWVTVLENMGFPAGLPKTMTVDLTGRLLSKPDYRVRITTNMRIYWDRILVDTSAEPTSPRIITLEAGKARLGWGGYPREYSPDGNKPLVYDYGMREHSAPWKSHAGSYTRYGDVKELVREKDNMYVIMSNGDEVTLDFDARSLPAPEPGWTRSFLVYAAGFGKDMDLNSAYPDTVGPLPFHGMRGYPYAGSYPSDSRHQRYLSKYNTRKISNIYCRQGFAAGNAVNASERPK